MVAQIKPNVLPDEAGGQIMKLLFVNMPRTVGITPSTVRSNHLGGNIPPKRPNSNLEPSGASRSVASAAWVALPEECARMLDPGSAQIRSGAVIARVALHYALARKEARTFLLPVQIAGDTSNATAAAAITIFIAFIGASIVASSR